jgi:hypothetical protein
VGIGLPGGVNPTLVNFSGGSNNGLLTVIFDTFLAGYHGNAAQDLTASVIVSLAS